MKAPKLTQIVWWISLVVVFSLSLVCTLSALLPYERIKPLVDSLAIDGDLESFTFSTYAQAGPWALAAGIGFLLLGIILIFARVKSQSIIAAALRQFSIDTFRKELHQLFIWIAQFLPIKVDLLALAAITIFALFIRLGFISQPIRHDEAYTFIAFAARPFRVVVSDYHLPNNHVFHTILVYLVYHLLGNQPWIVRLPALIAGLLVVPATYLVGRVFYNRSAGLLGAALVAAAPPFIDFSTSARGYTLVSLAFLIILCLAAFLREHNNRLAWGLFILVASLGFYTIPIMLYPFGLVMTWLLLCGVFKDSSPEYGKGFIKFLILAGLCVLVLTALLYSPILIYSGKDALLNNAVVESLDETAFVGAIWARLQSTWRDWIAGLPLAITILVGLGLIASLIFQRRLSRGRVPLVLAALLWIPFIVILQRVAPWPRVWLFLLPLFAVWASAGLFLILEGFSKRLSFEQAHRIAVAVAVLIPAAATVSYWLDPPFPPGTVGIDEKVAIFLKDYLQAGDIVLALPPMRAQVGYYFNRYGIPEGYFSDRQPDFEKAIVIVSEKHAQTLASVITQERLADRLDLASAKIIFQQNLVKLFEVEKQTQ